MLFKTKPDPHQFDAYAFAYPRAESALLMEQGTGKTKTAIDLAANWYAERLIDGMLVAAPNGVHIDWIKDQMAQHWPDSLPVEARWFVSGAGKKATAVLEEILVPRQAFRLLTINVEALIHSGGVVAERFLRSGRMVFAFDESSLIKTPSASTTRNAQRLARFAAKRLIMTGTEITEGPMDIYAQFQFLRPGLIGVPNFAAFKARYADWLERRVVRGGREHAFKEVVRYKNLDELKRIVAANSYQIRRKDCMALPPQIFQTRSVILSDEQRSAYNAVRERVLVEFEHGTLTTPLYLTRITRLAQIAGGFLPLDDLPDGEVRPLRNAKLIALTQEVDEISPTEQFIVWARFRAELDAITRMLTERGERPARWWGGVPNRNQEADEFKAGERRVMVAQPRAGGKGHNWIAGTTVLYYSNSFSYEDRKQTEDRSHRRGQIERVLYRDLKALDTVDEKILKALRAKQTMAEFFKTSVDNGEPIL